MTLREYFSKMRGGAQLPPAVSLKEIFWAGLGTMLGIGLCGFVSSLYLESVGLSLMLGSLGASAVIVYGATSSRFAQPRNLMGGHLICALIGVACHKLMGGNIWMAATIAISISVMAMLVTRTVHPPGGATALIAVMGGKQIYDLGFFYVLVPVTTGACLLLIVALLVNNLSGKRRYPDYWF